MSFFVFVGVSPCDKGSSKKTIAPGFYFRLIASMSLDSASRPIMAPSEKRYSTYSMTPSDAPTTLSTDSMTAEIRPIVDGLERLKNPRLADQRVYLNEEKTTNLQKLALSAKLERALDRRMSSQDAVMRPRKPSVVVTEKEKA